MIHLLLLGLLTLGPASAVATEPVTLREVEASVVTHPERIAAEAAVDAAAGSSLAAAGAFDPHLRGGAFARPMGYYDQATADVGVSWQSPLWGLSLDGGWRIGRGDFASYEGKAETLRGGEWYAGVSVPLLKGGFFDEARSDRLQAIQGERIAEAELSVALLELRAEAAAALWSWAAAGQALRVAEDLLALAEGRAAAVDKRIAEGAAAEIDALEIRRSLLSRRSKVAAAAAKERAAAAKLALYLRDANGQPVVPPRERLPTLPPVPEAALLRDVESLWAARPEAALWDAELRRATLARRLAIAQLLPKLDVKVKVAADVATQPDPPENLALPVAEGGVSFDVPVAFRAGRGKLQAAEAKLRAVEAKSRWVRDKLEARARELLAALEGARRQLRLAEEAAAVGDALAEAEWTRYQLGSADLLMVNLREQAAAAARQEVAWLRAEVLALEAQWRALEGE